MSLDEEIVRDRLFNQGKFGTFKGGGDKVGAALANFINARNDARARALRNREIENRNNQSNGVYANGSGVRVGNTGSEQEGFTPWQDTLKNGGYTFGDAINSADYGNDVKQTSPNKYTFNEEDYIPNAGNGYHLGDYPQTEMYGSPTDYQRQMAANAVGYNIGSFEPRQKKYFNPTGEQQPDNTMNITSQPIGQNYNQSIGSQYKNSTMGGTQGMNVPQSPNGFGQVFQNTENGGISVGYDGKKIDPFAIPTSQDNSVQVEGGANQVPRMRDHFGDSPYLTEDFKYDNWNKRATDAGIDDEISRRVLYEERIKPLIKEARDEELRQAFFTLNNPNASEQDKMNAMALIEYRKVDPFLEEDHQYKMGNVENPDYGSGSSAGNAVLKALGDYTEGDQWMSPDGTGNSRTQCSNFVSDVLRKIGLNIGSPNGDELMRQFGKAYHTGLDGIQAGDVLNFKDHVGIYVGNGQYVARNSSGGVHQGSMEEAIQAFGQPLGYGSVGELTGTSRRQKYIKDPNRVSQREIFNANNAYRNSVINTKQNAINAKYNKTKVKPISEEDAEQAIYDYADSEAPTFKQGHAIGKAWAQELADYADEFDGNVGQAARQMYYDYAAMNPEERGWSMSSEKLALGVGYAVAHAKGLDGQKASNEAKKVMGMLLGQKPQNNTDTGASTGASPKKGKKLSETATSSNPNGLDEREQAGALRELDEINHYDQKPTISNLNEVASFVKGDGRIGDGKIGDELVSMVENAGTSRVTPKRRNR